MKNFPEFDQKEIAIGCFGPATAKAVKDAGLRLDLEAPTVEAPSMTAALICLSASAIRINFSLYPKTGGFVSIKL